ncbi:MAG: hypothetical protein D4R67_10855 [Bacteroidetes bacterium]|nr:MAG: hypothetical protein D4R67_10855 [Bacteroidota bacterium]
MKKIYLFIILAAILTLPFSCKKFERLLLVRTLSVNATTKQAKGEVIDVAESTVEYGFCWGTNSDPTLANSSLKVGISSDPKSFETTLSGLQAGTTYYVRAYIRSDKGTEYGDPVKVTVSGSTTVEYSYDDGVADYGWMYNPNHEGWMGNYFPISSSGKIFSIEMYFAKFSSTPGNDQLNVDVFNANRTLIGSTSNFNQFSDSWVTIGANINYSGAIYVMVHWNYTQSETNFLGMDQNGPNVSMDLGYYHDVDNWGKCSSLTSGNQLPGIFLVRIYVQLTSGEIVIYEPRIDPGTNQLTMTESAGSKSMDIKNKNND